MCVLYLGCFKLFYNVWVCVCVCYIMCGGFGNCVGVMVIYVIVCAVFFIVSFMYMLFFFVLSVLV